MRALKLVGIAVVAVVLTCSPSFSESQPAAKYTAKVGNISVIDSTAMDWTTVLTNSIKTSQQKDLVVGVSLECGLYTSTLVRSKNGTSDTSTSDASIQVRVLIDGKEAYPGEVVFSHRKQQMTAVFQGLIDGCLILDPTTGAIIINPDCVKPEELELLLDTMDANAFVFILNDVGVGVHKVEVQARIETAIASQNGSATAKATVGKGSMSVEEVRMIRGEDILL